MASRLVNQKNGAFALPTGAYGSFQSFSVNESQGNDDVTAYGASTYGAYAFSGTPTQTLQCRGFILVGASSTSPGFGSMTSAGAATTVTFDTTTTCTGSYGLENITVEHDRRTGASKGSWSLRNAGDVTTSWAST